MKIQTKKVKNHRQQTGHKTQRHYYQDKTSLPTPHHTTPHYTLHLPSRNNPTQHKHAKDIPPDNHFVYEPQLAS